MRTALLSTLFGALLLSAPTRAEDIAPGDNLVVDGIPRLPSSIAEVAGQYNESRTATFQSWHPEKRQMLISTRFADTAQIHRVAFPLGDRKQLTFFSDRVGRAVYPPTSQRADHFLFSKDVGGGEFFQIYLFDVGTGAVTLLTDGKSRNSLGTFTRDGALFAYTSTRRNGKDTDLYLIDPLVPQSNRMLAQVDGGGWEPLDFSPDGKQLLVAERISVNESYLWLFDRTSGERTLLTPKGNAEMVSYSGGVFAADSESLFVATDKESEFKRLCQVDLATRKHTFLTNHIPWDVESFDLSPDGQSLAFVTNQDGIGILHLMDTRTGQERPVPKLPVGLVSRPRWHENHSEVAFGIVGARSPEDVYSLDTRTGEVTRWTESETGGLDASTFSEPELVRWQTFDGRMLSGFLYKPAAKFTGKHPVMINIHGGPEGQSRPRFLGRSNYFLNELGVALLFPNVRGSTGYGKTFAKLDNGFLREDSVKDIGSLLDWVGTRADLDPSRVLVSGGSYGGYMSLAVSTHYADRIRASVDIVGISSFVTFLENTEAYRRDLRRVEYGDERDPKMREFLLKIAPLANAAKITKPIFVVQGKNDPRVPLSEAEQMVAKLKEQKTPVWYLMAKDEGHGFDKKKNAEFQFYATVAFMREYLLN